METFYSPIWQLNAQDRFHFTVQNPQNMWYSWTSLIWIVHEDQRNYPGCPAGLLNWEDCPFNMVSKLSRCPLISLLSKHLQRDMEKGEKRPRREDKKWGRGWDRTCCLLGHATGHPLPVFQPVLRMAVCAILAELPVEEADIILFLRPLLNDNNILSFFYIRRAMPWESSVICRAGILGLRCRLVQEAHPVFYRITRRNSSTIRRKSWTHRCSDW